MMDDQSLIEAMDEFEDNIALAETANAVERQIRYQEQIGGNPLAREPGRFVLDVNPYRDRRSERMGVAERHYTANLRQEGQFVEQQRLTQALSDAVHTALQNLIRTENIPGQDYLYFNLASNRLNHAYGYRRLTADEWMRGSERVDGILQQMARVLNSNEQFELDDSFQLSFTQVRATPQGSGHKRKMKPGHSHPETFKRLKHAVVTIKNKDDLCCGRAIVTAKAKVDGHPNWEGFKMGRAIQKSQAVDLYFEAGVQRGPCGYDEIIKFALAPSLQDYQLLLIDETRGFRVDAFGPSQDKQLVLLYNQQHYDVVTTLPGYFGTSYFCGRCLKPYNDEGRHACDKNLDHCPACLQNVCSGYREAKAQRRPASLPCDRCKRSFYGETCLQQHFSRSYKGKVVDAMNVSVCTHKRKCVTCQKLMVGMKKQRKHQCGFADCPSCHEYVDTREHQCFIQVAKSPEQEKEERDKKKKKKKRGAAAGLATLAANGEPMDIGEEEKPPLHVFFDIEAMQNTKTHVANLVVAETEDDDHPFHFKGDSCMTNFLEWLDTLTAGDTRDVTVIAHNFQGYDGYFVIDEYHRQNRIVEQVRNGGKIMQLNFDRIRFIDSLSFFQMPLSAFPKTFGLTELKKGYFPHLFNRPENQSYVGPIPAQHYYMPEVMSVSGRKAFETWHAKQTGIFDFAEELVAYCESDVKLLKEGCLKFKKLFEEKSKFNPFSCMTIASACNRDLRQNRMEPNTIASEPLHGWRLNTNHSHVSLEWLHWEDSKLRRIQHARNKGEFRIPNSNYTVDGYDEATKTVYEFQGCFWHGCRTCYPNRSEPHRRLEDRSMEDVFICTQRKIFDLASRGYNVKQMWECQWAQLKQNDPAVRDFVNKLNIVSPLNPRDAFCGGRTNAIKLYHKTEDDEEIDYYDFTSLYPYVNKNKCYPIGHPQIIFEPEGNIFQYFGIAKCTVLPPYELYHPVLPLRQNDKLTFPLCRSCVETEMEKPMLERSYVCNHSDEQRQITGTWCTPELQEAVKRGYKILHIHEVWHFSETREGLFGDYVNTWLKIKEEASGWPEHVGNDSVKQQEHVTKYYEKEKIQLDPAKIEKNPGLRTLAKMMLNSMWGKFGQKPNKTQVKEFDDPIKFHEFHDSDKYDIRYVSVLTEQRVEIHYKHQLQDDPVSPNLNIFIACFTTCWARLKLYEQLGKLKERVLYFDTDSVIFKTSPGQKKPELDEYLGDFKNELNEGDTITEFASGGPKNYGYQTRQGKQECKVRGISLNSEGSKQLNFPVLRQNVLDDILEPLTQARQTAVRKPYHIVRQAKDYSIQTEEQTKNYQLVYSKRVIDRETFMTYPYGYKAAFDPEDLDNIDTLLAL